MNVGDAVLMRSVKSDHFDKDTGRWAATYTFKAPKGKAFMFVLLGAIDTSDATQFDTEPSLNDLGWYFCEDCQKKNGQLAK